MICDFSPQVVPQDDVVCVTKDAVQDKNAVNIKLKASSNCVSGENTYFRLLRKNKNCMRSVQQNKVNKSYLVKNKFVCGIVRPAGQGSSRTHGPTNCQHSPVCF